MRRLFAAAGMLSLIFALAPVSAEAAPSLPTVGVVDSETTYVNFAQQGWWTERPPRTAQALSDAGYPVVTLTDDDLENPAALASVDVVYLPLTRVVSEQASLNLRDWVADGGGLIGSFISPRMLARPGCQWTGANHPRYTANIAANWTCWGVSHGGFEFWAKELKSAVWEYGPLSDVYQNVFINDPSPKQFSILDGSAHEITTKTKAALGIGSIRFDRPSGAGAEFVRIFNSNATSILTFDIPPGTGSGEGVDASQYDGYTAAQAIRYGNGRAVYFDFDILDFLPNLNYANSQQTHQGVKQGDIALELIEQSIAWVANPVGSSVIDRDARTWGEVDVYNSSIYIRQKIVAEGNMPTTGTMAARIYDPDGTLVYENLREFIGLYPGGPILSFSLPGYKPAGGLRSDGSYRIEMSYVYSYPEFDLLHLDAVDVTKNQGTGIVTSPVIGGSLPERFAGPDRYATAVEASKAVFGAGSDVVYVTTGLNYPDAIAGGAGAAVDSAPILLVTKDVVPAITREEIKRLAPSKIVVVGGEGVISPNTMALLGTYVPGVSVVRRAGPTRFETAVEVSKGVFGGPVDTVYVVGGFSFADAVVAAPAAIRDGGPLLLVHPNLIPTAVKQELTRLSPNKIVVVGGAAAVPNSVMTELGAYAANVSRISGSDRYAVGAAVSSTFPASTETVYVAVGTDYPDALAGGAISGQDIGPMLLVKTTEIPNAVKNELLRIGPTRIIILGGTGVVSEGVRVQLASYLD